MWSQGIEATPDRVRLHRGQTAAAGEPLGCKAEDSVSSMGLSPGAWLYAEFDAAELLPDRSATPEQAPTSPPALRPGEGSTNLGVVAGFGEDDDAAMALARVQLQRGAAAEEQRRDGRGGAGGGSGDAAAATDTTVKGPGGVMISKEEAVRLLADGMTRTKAALEGTYTPMPAAPTELLPTTARRGFPPTDFAAQEADRVARKVLELHVQGKNFPRDAWLELHEDSTVGHLRLAIAQCKELGSVSERAAGVGVPWEAQLLGRALWAARTDPDNPTAEELLLDVRYGHLMDPKRQDTRLLDMGFARSDTVLVKDRRGGEVAHRLRGSEP